MTTRFLKTNAGFIDLAEVAYAQVGQTGHRRPGQRGHAVPGAVTQFLDDAGKELAVGREIDLEALTSPLVPSSAVVIAIAPTGATTAHPVAAYRVLRAGAAEPVFAVNPPEGATLFQAVGATGFVRLGDGGLFPDLPAARQSVTGAPPAVVAPTPVAPTPVPPTPTPVAVAGKRR
jgi:hypothetical protein